MRLCISASCTVGVVRLGDGFRAVSLVRRRGSWCVEKIVEGACEEAGGLVGALTPERLPLLDLGQPPLFVVGVDAREVLVRQMEVPLHRSSDIDASLEFQAEPLLPYPIEEALLDKVVLSRDREGAILTLLAVRRSAVDALVKGFLACGVEPDVISCVPQALVNLARVTEDLGEAAIVVHLGEEAVTFVLLERGKLLAARGLSRGGALSSGSKKSEYFQEVCRSFFALTRQWEGAPFERVHLVGPMSMDAAFVEELSSELGLAALQMVPSEALAGVSIEEFHRLAVPIGLALAGQPSVGLQVDFLQKAGTTSRRWQRLKKPLLAYLAASLVTAILLVGWGKFEAIKTLSRSKEGYVELLALLGKSYDQFEEEYRATKPIDPAYLTNKTLLSLDELDAEALNRRLFVLNGQTKVLTTPIALLPDVPQVSDVLSWLSGLAKEACGDEQEVDGRLALQMENFAYTMVKRPEQNKPKERYQVRVELEFSTSVPRIARELHRELLEPNAFIDPASEVTWTVTRQKYRTSFLLKDKTRYP